MKLAERIIEHSLITPPSLLMVELSIAKKLMAKLPWYLAEDALDAIFDLPEDAKEEDKKKEAEDA